MTFITLATIVWALMTTGFMSYYYMEQTKFQNQLDEKQHLLNELAENYETSTTKRNLLTGDYGTLLGEYQWHSSENYSSLMGKYEKLLSNLSGNYTPILNAFPELNNSYSNLLSTFQTLNENSQVSKEEFGSLLDDFYELFMALTMKESEGFLGKVSEIEVNLCIDYGNLTVKWFNTSVSPSASLFDLTQKVAEVEYSYWQTMEPGHILITSINNYAEGYWIWYYWDEVNNEWVFGPVGCDAWILNNNGIYKWFCSS
jgi:hypothetical protein